ncbi:MAG: hypothetical protein AAB691_05015 [Patescibacteria group bacterium]
MKTQDDNKMTRQIIALVGSAFLLWTIYFGSYLPLQKSKAFIITLQSMDQMRSLDDVKRAFATPFDIPSPIGQEEVVRHFASVILSTIQRFEPDQASTSVELVGLVKELFDPIITRQRGMSFDQNLYVLGSMHQVVALQTKDPQYLEKAEEYLTLGRQLAPHRPQFLYGLFDLYRLQGDNAKALEVANTIIQLWPMDDRVKAYLESQPAQPKATTTTVR